MNLQPPFTNVVYNSFDDLFKAVNTHAAAEGFAFAIKRSKKSEKEILRKVWLECDKSGSYKAKGHGCDKRQLWKMSALVRLLPLLILNKIRGENESESMNMLELKLLAQQANVTGQFGDAVLGWSVSSSVTYPIGAWEERTQKLTWESGWNVW